MTEDQLARLEPIAGPEDAAQVDAAAQLDDAPDATAAAPDATAAEPALSGDVSLLELIDRLEALLERSELTELEVEAGGTALVLRSPAAIAQSQPAMTAAASGDGPALSAGTGDPAEGAPEPATTRRAVLAPLTGLFYGSPSPDAQPYVRPGGDVQVGQVIGLIEAMKLFNEIKSDVSGKIIRICAENGALVKAKQPLIEVEPS